MSILTDWQIRERTMLPEGDPRRLALSPWVDYGDCPPGRISYGLTCAGYDLHVGLTFLLFNNTAGCIVDPKDFRRSAFTEIHTEIGETVLIPPNSFALAETVEYIEMPRDVMGDIKGRSTLARCGYCLPTTPVEPGWRGILTLEIGNLSPLPMAVYAGEGIAQIVFHRLDAMPERDYGMKASRYQDQQGLTTPRV